MLDTDGDGTADASSIFVHDAGQIVLDFVHTGTGDATAADLAHRYLWGPAVDQFLAQETVDDGGSEDVLWALTDHLNSVRDLAQYDEATDTTTVARHLVYDAFGNLTSDTAPAVPSLFLYTARPFDADTGLQNNLHRWYEARVGRWLSEDPIGFEAADGNLYRYVRNASTGLVDPWGLAGMERLDLLYDFNARVRLDTAHRTAIVDGEFGTYTVKFTVSRVGTVPGLGGALPDTHSASATVYYAPKLHATRYNTTLVKLVRLMQASAGRESRNLKRVLSDDG